jgi:hypothetical protein
MVCQSPRSTSLRAGSRLPPDFLSGSGGVVKPRAAFLKESRIRGRWLVQRVGNPESAPNDKPETGALSAAYPTQAQRQGLNGAPQPSLPVQEAGSLLP